MNRINIDLTGKELFLLTQALEAHIEELDIKIESSDTSEDEYSDIQNDFMVLKPMLIRLKEVLNESNPR